MPASSQVPMFLVPVAGPPLEAISLPPDRTSLRLGRDQQCELAVPVAESRVSRVHAKFDHDGARWRLSDLKSRWGTYVNGVRLAPENDFPLGEGDLIRISPWTFMFSASPSRMDSIATDDALTTQIRNVSG